jgi:hypothetical protein
MQIIQLYLKCVLLPVSIQLPRSQQTVNEASAMIMKADNCSQVFNGLLGLWELGSSGHIHLNLKVTLMMVTVYTFEILEETNYTIHCKNPEKHHL